MRAPFNLFFNVYSSREGAFAPPGRLLVSDVPGRRVYQDEIIQQHFPYSQTDSWLTQQFVDLDVIEYGGIREGVLWENYNSALIVEVPAGSGEYFAYVRGETIAVPGRAQYWRGLLLPLAALSYPLWPPAAPLPPPPPVAPGTSCATAPLIATGDVIAGTRSPGDDYWWSLGAQLGGTYHVQLTIGHPTVVVEYWVGTACGSVASAGSTAATGRFSWTGAGSGLLAWLRVRTGAGPTAFSASYDTGP